MVYFFPQQAFNTRLPPQCNSPPNLSESPLATAARLFSQLWSVLHPSFPGKSIPLRLGLVSQSKQGFDKWKSRCAVTWSHRSKSPARFSVRVCFYSCMVPSLESFPYSVKFLPDPFTRWQQQLQNTPSETPLTQSWTISRGFDWGRNQRHTFSKIRARNRQRLTNVICLELLRLGGPIISNRPPIWFVCSSACVSLCMCGPLIVEYYKCWKPPLYPLTGVWMKKPGCYKPKF